jgi:site-specific DNA recombinase
MRAIICDRVSSEDQRDKGGRKERMLALRDYCERNGFEIVDEIVDEVTGVRPIRERRNGIRIYAHIESRTTDAVVWFDIDRVARDEDGLEYLQLRKACRDAGVELHFVKTGKADLANPMGGLADYFKALGAAEERRKIAERTSQGRANKTRQGRAPTWGTPVYGFKVVKMGDQKQIVIDQHEAGIITRARDLILGKGGRARMSVIAVCAQFDKDGVPVPSTSRRKKGERKYQCWHPASLRGILRNRALIGEWEYAGIAVQQESLAILPKEDFDALDAQIKANRTASHGAKKREYLMARRLKCICGEGMYGWATKPHGKEHLYYMCNGTKLPKSERHCTDQRLRAPDTDIQAWNWFCDLLSDPQALREGIRRKQEQEAKHTQPLQDRIKQIDKAIESERAEIGKLIRQRQDLEPDTEPYKQLGQQMREADARIKQMTGERKAKEKQLAGQQGMATDEETIMRQVEQVRAKIDRASFKTRRALIDRFDVRGQVIIEDGERKVKYSCGLIEAINIETATSRYCD